MMTQREQFLTMLNEQYDTYRLFKKNDANVCLREQTGFDFDLDIAFAESPVGVHGLADLGCHIFGHAFTVHGFGGVVFIGHGVDFRMPRFAQGLKSCVVDDDGIGLITADHAVKAAFLPV